MNNLALPLGKIPPEILRSCVLKLIGSKSSSVLVRPKLGVDFSVISLSKGFLICSSDPITGVSENIGWYAVNVASNDVATSGAVPEFIQSIILLPDGSVQRELSRVARDIHLAAKGIGVSITGGHTEIVPKLTRPIVIVTCFAQAEEYVTSEMAKKDDIIIMTKTAGLEGASIIARSNLSDRLNRSVVKRAKEFTNNLSVVQDALVAYRTGFVHAMHDVTEGGLIGGLCEMTAASKLGFTVRKNSIPVAEETRIICELVKVNPLKLIGSGSLLIAADPKGASEVIRILASQGIQASAIGKFTKAGRILLKANGEKERVPGTVTDELWRLERMSTKLDRK